MKILQVGDENLFAAYLKIAESKAEKIKKD